MIIVISHYIIANHINIFFRKGSHNSEFYKKEKNAYHTIYDKIYQNVDFDFSIIILTYYLSYEYIKTSLVVESVF